jgi:multidrug efflux pump subunit AcrB
MNIPEFSVKQRLLVNLVVVVLGVWGILTYLGMPREVFPTLSWNEGYVLTYYLGASPKEVETLITQPIEEEIQDVKDIDFIESSSSEGRSVIRVVFDESLSMEEVEDAVDELKAEVDKVTDLPPDAEDPWVFEIDSELIWPALLVAISGDMPLTALKEVADDLEDVILDIPGVSSIGMQGYRDPEIRVEVDPDKLEAYRLTVEEVQRALAAGNVNLPAGTSDIGRQAFIVRTVGEFTSVEEIGDLPLRAHAQGVLRLRDVATVERGLEKAESYFRVDGREGVSLIVYKKDEYDLINVSKAIRQSTERFKAGLQVPVTIEYREDLSGYVADTLGVLRNNAILGAILVIGAIWLVLGFRNALLAAFGIPFTFIAAFIFMNILGITLNFISLFALVLVLGMVVDDAIVIIENVHRKYQQGMPMRQAAVQGTLQVMAPVTASVTTTALAFLPMLLMEGTIGKFLQYIPKTVAFALLASLLEAFWVLPAHMVDFGSRAREARRPGAIFLDRLLPRYRALLSRLIRRKYITAGTAFVLFLGAIFLAGQLDVELFPEADVDIIYVSMEMAPGTRLDETLKVVDEIESLVESLPEDELISYVSTVGRSFDPQSFRTTVEPHVAQIVIDLESFRKRARGYREIAHELREKVAPIPGIVSIHFEGPNSGPPAGKPVEIRVRGDDLARLKELANVVKGELKTLPGVFDITDDLKSGKNELQIHVDEETAALRGVSIAQVAVTARAALYGIEATEYRGDENEEIDVLVKLKGGDSPSIRELKRLMIRSTSGELVPLSAVADVSSTTGYNTIWRRDLDRAVTMTGDIDREETTPTEVQQAVTKAFPDFSTRYPGYVLEFGGEYERTQSSFASMFRAIIVAMLLIYTVLVIQFRSLSIPLVVLFTVPFSIIGVVIGLFIMGLPMDIDSLVAVLALCGLVVNGSIVLVSFINEARSRGTPREEAVLEAAGVRMRPILLTNFTTIFGLLPMALGLGGISTTWRPMATSLIWGLAFASLVTLIVIPAFYLIGDDLRKKTSWRKKRIKAADDIAGPEAGQARSV